MFYINNLVLFPLASLRSMPALPTNRLKLIHRHRMPHRSGYDSTSCQGEGVAHNWL